MGWQEWFDSLHHCAIIQLCIRGCCLIIKRGDGFIKAISPFICQCMLNALLELLALQLALLDKAQSFQEYCFRIGKQPRIHLRADEVIVIRINRSMIIRKLVLPRAG